jgi:sodium/potassium-transporting ATPase subunit alpha
MAEKNVLVKSTLIVETLGSITCVASDKTGTLTQNRMTVRNAIYSDGVINVTRHPNKRSATNVMATTVDDEKREPAAPGAATGDAKFIPYYNDLVKSAGLCNHATFDEREHDILMRRTNGDASENALLKFSHSNGNSDILRKTYPEIACIPFNSTNKFMVTLHTIPDSDDYLCLMKGAPERVLEKCTTYTDTSDNKVKDFDAAMNAQVVKANTQLATNGERVLAFAQKTLSGLGKNFEFQTEDLKNLNFSITDFRFTGMLSLEDPPRTEVPDAIVKCHEAGIRVIMVTGDHPLTARSIAAQIGILTEADGGKEAYIFDNKLSGAERRPENKSGIVVTGDLLATLDDDDWKYILSRNGTVFARTLPTQKQDIVKRLQDNGEIVAVTGDGVNDSPALKQAQVGIAMGTGSEVAKEAADLILMDDNFASIVKGIEEGRKIFANLKKSIAYTLTSNIPEIIPFLAQIALKLPLGLTTIMILCVDLGTDILPAISFAYETSESDIMKQKPRNVNVDKLVTWQLISWSYLQIGIIQAMAAFTTLFFVLNKLGYTTSFILDSKPGFDWSNPDCDPNGTGSSTVSGSECEVKCFEKYSGGWEEGTLICASYDEREEDLKLAQTAFLASIVVCQMGCGVAAKTRITSIIDQGFANKVFNIGVLQETVLIILLVYAPFLQPAFGTRDTSIDEWLIAVPFALCIWLYDEARKYLMREYPDSEFKKNLFF